MCHLLLSLFLSQEQQHHGTHTGAFARSLLYIIIVIVMYTFNSEPFNLHEKQSEKKPIFVSEHALAPMVIKL
jgi:hypothetical protein